MESRYQHRVIMKEIINGKEGERKQRGQQVEDQMQILLWVKGRRNEGNLGAKDLGFSVDQGEYDKAIW